MIFYFRVIATALLIYISSALAVDAGEIKKSDRPECTHEFSGRVEKGDAQKIVTSIRGGSGFPRLCLDSNGGDFQEALKFVNTMTDIFKTVVPEGSSCLSACAIMFLAGHDDTEGLKFPWRDLHIRGKLGFHGPYVKLGDEVFTREETEAAFRSGVTVIAQLLQTGDARLFPKSLLAEALAVGPEQFLYIDTVGEAGAWKIRLYGYALPNQLRKRHVTQACGNVDGWNAPHGGSPLTKLEPGVAQPGDNEILEFSARMSRTVLDNHGAEASQHCVAVLHRAGPGFYGLNVDIVSDPKTVPNKFIPMDFGDTAWFNSSSVGTFAVFPMRTKLEDLEVERRQIPKYELPLTCTDGTRTWECKEPPKVTSPSSPRTPQAQPRPRNRSERVTPGFGWATGYRTRKSAERRALKGCPGKCKIAVWFSNGCGAIASGLRGGWGSAAHRRRVRARNIAVRQCRKVDRRCRPLKVVCTRRSYGAIAVQKL